MSSLANPTPPEACEPPSALLGTVSIRLWAPVANGIAAVAEAFPATSRKTHRGHDRVANFRRGIARRLGRSFCGGEVMASKGEILRGHD